MMHAHTHVDGRLRPVEGIARETVWIDLVRPAEAEERAVQAALGVNVPTRAEMAEIEASSRLYRDGTAAVMTVMVPSDADADVPTLVPITFVLAGERLVTVRHHELRAVETFAARAVKAAPGCGDGEGVMVALLETIVDRLADLVERAVNEVDALSRALFQSPAEGAPPRGDVHELLRQLGRKGDLNSKIVESLMTLERLAGFLGPLQLEWRSLPRRRARLRTFARDVASLADYAGFLERKIGFLLDATLGLVGIEQNATIKIFSVVAVVFLPPTLIASIYGMNFARMPELAWPLGYPAALVLMVLSAILPYWLFKRRRWL
jgi:magnesium transporter